MSNDILHQIKNAEQQAETIIRQSVDDARQILYEASQKAQEFKEQSESDVADECRNMIAKAEASAEVETALLEKKLEEDRNTVLDKAGQNLDTAVKMVVERIVKAYGNS